MPMPTVGRHTARALAVAGAILLAASIHVIAPAHHPARAEVVEVGPNPGVSSRQADAVAGNSTHGGIRRAPRGTVRGQGETKRDSVKAVPGDSRARPFLRGSNNYPGMGSW
ncbi:hypothetical protein [[Mycobacterium] burgundiense]|uniref:Uncharacterized protein n=1 Tax=[Mycobacterium] burgundiense TaxID=3064286 RepID=A0ABN9NJU4_9MYCO|nr:hypothetical protein [Mycolicibacterium sp. MU0053]CAJ1507677.1 hypothetical protein MU0053_003592 [Mycolicibacterium sp. MU0053]